MPRYIILLLVHLLIPHDFLCYPKALAGPLLVDIRGRQGGVETGLEVAIASARGGNEGPLFVLQRGLFALLVVCVLLGRGGSTMGYLLPRPVDWRFCGLLDIVASLVHRHGVCGRRDTVPASLPTTNLSSIFSECK